MTRNLNWYCGQCMACSSENITEIEDNAHGCNDCGQVHPPNYRCECTECRLMRQANPAQVETVLSFVREKLPMLGLLLVTCGWLLVTGASTGSATAASDCPRPTEMTAPYVGPWLFVEHGPTYAHIEVWFTLHDGFGDPESPLYLYWAWPSTGSGDGEWQTTVDLDQQQTVCIDQYAQFIDFSLTVLNEGERPFTYDNHEDVADYEAFLLAVREAYRPVRVFLPMVLGGG